MVISSRTPEGEPNHCPICHHDVIVDPSLPFGDGPCPHCGCLLTFESTGVGAGPNKMEATLVTADTVKFRARYVCPGCQMKIPFGKVTAPPPTACPRCERKLFIPTFINLKSDKQWPAASGGRGAAEARNKWGGWGRRGRRTWRAVLRWLTGAR